MLQSLLDRPNPLATIGYECLSLGAIEVSCSGLCRHHRSKSLAGLSCRHAGSHQGPRWPFQLVNGGVLGVGRSRFGGLVFLGGLLHQVTQRPCAANPRTNFATAFRSLKHAGSSGWGSRSNRSPPMVTRQAILSSFQDASCDPGPEPQPRARNRPPSISTTATRGTPMTAEARVLSWNWLVFRSRFSAISWPISSVIRPT